jgi:hypothetical protein
MPPPSTAAPTAATGQALPAKSVDLLSIPRYSQDTYLGRVRHFFSVIDPRTLLVSQSQIQQSVQLLQKYKNGERTGVTQDQIWQAKKIKVSTNMTLHSVVLRLADSVL